MDTATYAGAPSAVVVTLASSGPQNTLGAGTDTISQVENLTGSSFNDTLTGTTLTNTLKGAAGDDSLDGGAGPDVCNGGSGTDTAFSCETVTGVP